MVVANIRGRKVQSFLIFTTILIATLLLATAFGIMNNLYQPFETMFEAQNGSHLVMQFWRGNSPNVEDAINWWQSQDQVIGVQTFPYFWMKEQLALNGEFRTMGDLIVTEHSGVRLSQDMLRATAGEDKPAPGPGELWVPTGYAYSWGIQLGDILEFPVNGVQKRFTVSAIIVDPQYSSSVMNPVRVWGAPGLIEEEGPEQLLAIRCRDASSYRGLWLKYEEFLGHPVPGFLLDYDMVAQGYSEIEGLAGAILLLFSGIIILVALIAIAFTITNGIILDLKTIGVLGAQGFSPGNIKWIYVLQFLGLALAAIPGGILLSKPVVNMLMGQTLNCLGLATGDGSLLKPALVTALIMAPLILAVSFLGARRAGKVKPAEAVRLAGRPAEGARTTWDITKDKKLPVTLLLGLKMALTNKRHSLFLLAAAAILTFVLVFSFNTYNSIKVMGENRAYWGFDDADVFVQRPDNWKLNSHDEVMAPLLRDPRTKSVLPVDYALAAAPAKDGNPTSTVLAFIYDGDMSAAGVLNLEGRNPQYSNEAALTAITAQECGKEIGDMIDLFVQGKTDSYLVTGIFQSINSGGRGFRIQEAAVRKNDPDFRVEVYSIKLKDGVNAEEYIRDVQKLLPTEFTVKTAEDSGVAFPSITAGTALIALTLSVVFTVIAFIIIFNLTLMSIYSERKDYGIYKALGMTPLQTRLCLVAKAGVLALVGAVLAIPFSLLLTPRALSYLAVDLGLVRFPFSVTVLGTLAALPIGVLVAMLSTWLPAGKILKISPRSLAAE